MDSSSTHNGLGLIPCDLQYNRTIDEIINLSVMRRRRLATPIVGSVFEKTKRVHVEETKRPTTAPYRRRREHKPSLSINTIIKTKQLAKERRRRSTVATLKDFRERRIREKSVVLAAAGPILNDLDRLREANIARRRIKELKDAEDKLRREGDDAPMLLLGFFQHIDTSRYVHRSTYGRT